MSRIPMNSTRTPDGGGGATVSGARLPVHEAGADSLAGRAVAAAGIVSGVSEASTRLIHDVGTSLTDARSGAGEAVVAAGGRLQVSFHDIEAMAREIAALGSDATELAARTARIAIDGDLLASCSVSPITGMTAEAAIGVAATGLAQTAVQATALALATAGVASSYAAADAWLAAAAGTLRASSEAAAALAPAGAAFVGSLAGGAVTAVGAQVRADAVMAAATADTVADLGIAAAAVPVLAAGGVAAVASGFGAEAARSLGTAFAEANRAFGGPDDAINPFVPSDVMRYGAVLAAGFDRTFSLDDALAGSVGGVQALLAATGPVYDDILAGLVTAGVAVGFFHDGDVTVGRAQDVDAAVLHESAAVTWNSLGREGDVQFDTIEGRIVPTDWPSMMAGLAQIDELGGDERAIIRVFSVFDSDGAVVSHRVQIPSTASWNPIAGASGSPGDLTSDVYSMWQGSEAALASAVFEAMRQAGVATGAEAPPIVLDGFSLGGIAAAAIAADPKGFNVTEIHTAGSPIGNAHIDGETRVFALEADHDLIAALDGRPNPERSGWLTVSGPGVPLAGEGTPAMLPGTVHSARRYAMMGSSAPELENVGALEVPPGGTVTVADFQSRREMR